MTGDEQTTRTHRRDHLLARDLTRPVVLDREDDSLVGHIREPGVTEPQNLEFVTITREPDDSDAGFAGYNKLKIPADELDDYVELLTELQEVNDGR